MITAPNTTNKLGTMLSVFACPSDTQFKSAGESGFGRSSYVVCRGNINYFGQSSTNLPGPGVFYCNSNTSVRDVTDGTSNTFAAGEVSDRQYAVLDGGPTTGGLWAGMIYHKKDDMVMRTTHATHPLNRSTPSLMTTAGANDNDGFGSLHTGGAYFLFCDGHVRFISENIDATQYGRLGDKADGNVIGEY